MLPSVCFFGTEWLQDWAGQKPLSTDSPVKTLFPQGNKIHEYGRGKTQSVVLTQTQRKQDENASLIKGTKPDG